MPYITYYAPWGNLAIFYRDFRYSSGLIKLGSIDAGGEKLATYKKPVEVRLDKFGQ
ncbi:cyclophilin-like fold protein [Paenibacillus caui]|uniref:cyclophilin-like fold protein n=1 Tax=Paenibacillus caui TaxID=2873927 RepID=UPI0030800B0E